MKATNVGDSSSLHISPYKGSELTSVNDANMKGMDEDQPWNIIEEPPLGHCKKRQPMPLEGSWKLISNDNFEAYLLAVGVTPLIATMVMR